MANYISKHTGKQIDAAVDAFLAGGGSGGTGSVEVDTTLTQSGKAADAKATGDRLTALSEEIEGLKENGGGGSSADSGAVSELSQVIVDLLAGKSRILFDLGQWQRGSVNSSTGAVSSTTLTLVTEMFEVTKPVKINCAAGYKYALTTYRKTDSDPVLVGRGGFVTTETAIYPMSDYIYRVEFMNSAGTVITTDKARNLLAYADTTVESEELPLKVEAVQRGYIRYLVNTNDWIHGEFIKSTGEIQFNMTNMISRDVISPENSVEAYVDSGYQFRYVIYNRGTGATDISAWYTSKDGVVSVPKGFDLRFMLAANPAAQVLNFDMMKHLHVEEKVAIYEAITENTDWEV